MSSGPPRRCGGVTDRKETPLCPDDAPGHLSSGPLPTWAERRIVSIAVGGSMPFVEADWNDSLVVIDAGDLEIECQLGGRRRFDQGAVLWLAGIDARLLHNVGDSPTVLIAVSRRNRSP